jgi:hypothetical protein
MSTVNSSYFLPRSPDPFAMPNPLATVAQPMPVGAAAQMVAQPTQAANVGNTAADTMRAAAGPASLVNPLLGAGLAIGGTAAGIATSFANNAVQRRNRAALEALQRRETAGTLGLTPLQKRQLQAQLQSPVARAAAEGRLAAERQAASMQNGSAGDLQAVQAQQTAMNAAASQQAAQQVAAANAQRAAEQKAEIDARLQAQAQMRADDYATILGTAAKTAAAGGAIAGAPPGTMPDTLLGAAGLPVRGTAFGGAPSIAGLGLGPDELAQLQELSPPDKERVLGQIRAALAMKRGG